MTQYALTVSFFHYNVFMDKIGHMLGTSRSVISIDDSLRDGVVFFKNEPKLAQRLPLSPTTYEFLEFVYGNIPVSIMDRSTGEFRCNSDCPLLNLNIQLDNPIYGDEGGLERIGRNR